MREQAEVLQPLGQLQGLDLGIRQETSSSVECRETRCKTRRSSGTSAAAGERARVVEEPHRVQSQVRRLDRWLTGRAALCLPMGTLVRRRVGQDLCSPVDKVSRMCEGVCFALSEHLFVQEREVLWSLGGC